MTSNVIKRHLKVLLSLLLLTVMALGSASAEVIDLCAGEATITMEDGTPITVWGFGDDPTGTGPCSPTVPGPVLRTADADIDTVLTINLRNTLTEPVSLHILGQRLSNNSGPVWDDGTPGDRPDPGAPVVRVRSFTHEAAAGGSATYMWNDFKPGTYMLQSATNPAKQVQMGLVAAVIKDATVGSAYAGVLYDSDLVVVYQDIDPAIHAAVAADNYGETADPLTGGITSSVYREPRYFLINGVGYPNAALDPINSLTPLLDGQRLLIRLINAGSETRFPQLLQDYLSMVAEDGVPRLYPSTGYSFELNPAKTMDTIFVPTLPGRYPLIDGGLELTDAGTSPGGLMAFINADCGVSCDVVTITSAIYNAGDQTLQVKATSSVQPGVTLTAEGLGSLYWIAGANEYRRKFTGVATQPPSVTVNSSGGGTDTFTVPAAEIVTITSAIYNAGDQTLQVKATSSVQPGVTLTAEGLGSLYWIAGANEYRRKFTGVATQPPSVTVNSSGGGTDTFTVPAAEIVTITSAIYNAGDQTLQVKATSSVQPGVTLTAEGLGNLYWIAGANEYRRKFTGVATQPPSVTVNSSGGGTDTFTVPAAEIVTITSIVYDAGAQTLQVKATSSNQPGVTLTAEGLGNLYWIAGANEYRRKFTGVATQPPSVTVNSSGGGSDTAP